MSRLVDLKNIIGDVHKSNEGTDFRIIAISDKRTKLGNLKVVAKSLKSGYEVDIDYYALKQGRVKDYGVPTVKGIGFSYKGCDSASIVYKRWSGMLERCYDPKFSKYQWYGGKGVKVCDRWLHYKNFEEDIKKLKNYDNFLENPRAYGLDKDIIGDGMLYSPETCMFANMREQVHAQNRTQSIVAIDKEGNKTTYISINDCCKQLGLQDSNVHSVLRGARKHTKGYTFERLEKKPSS